MTAARYFRIDHVPESCQNALMRAQTLQNQRGWWVKRDMSGKGRNIWFERALLESKALRSLRTPTAHFVFGVFMTKRQWVEVGRKGKEQWHIKNNGEIEFTYKEAQRKYGIAESTFGDAIDELLDKGFIDIAASGQGTHRVTNFYAISDRWRLYGSPDYEKPKPRPKKPINRGFQKGNQYGRNCGKKKKSTVIEQHSSTVTGQHSDNVGKQDNVAEAT